MSEELQNLTFEAALEQLENLVARMENGQLPLEELMKNFEQGSELAKVCRTRLDALERKIEVLTRDDGAEGEYRDFDDPAPDRNNAPPF